MGAITLKLARTAQQYRKCACAAGVTELCQ